MVQYFDHTRFVFANKKPTKGIDIYNEKVCQSPLTGSIPYADTDFDICNIYNQKAAIQIQKDNLTNSASNIAYQI